MNKLIVLTALLFSSQALATLPPYWQRAQEFRSIFDSAEVATKLRGALISNIERQNDNFLIQAGNCTLTVLVRYEISNTPIIGPTRFTLLVNEPVCEASP